MQKKLSDPSGHAELRPEDIAQKGGALPFRATEVGLEELRAALIHRFPELAGLPFTMLTAGWDSIAVDVDGRLIFKFPRDEVAARRLSIEVSLLTVIRPVVTMPVPDLELYPGTPTFSRHEKLKGEHLVTRQYERLPVASKDRLAADMALFYAELHGLRREQMEAAGARPIEPWIPPEDILRRTWHVLPPDLRNFAERTVTAWQQLPPDPFGTTYGFFDGHGWNMAFDHEHGRLSGMYDFADSGFGPLHQEFIYTDFIDEDLTDRIVAEYETLTGWVLDRERIALLSSVLRLSELAGLAEDVNQLPGLIRMVADRAVRQPK